VDIEAKIYDVTLNDEFQFGIDWNHVAAAYEGTLGFGTTTLPTAIGSAASGLGSSALGGLNTTPGTAITTAGDISGVGNTLVFNNLNTSAAVTALKTQGSVEVVAAPRIRTMNNQTAVVKVGLEMPFFAESSTTTPGATGSSTLLAESTILSITPQISEDGWITMDINPVLTAYVKSESASDNSATAAELSDKQAFAMARVRDNTTVVLGGLIQTEKDKNDNKVPVLGDIPLMGKLFTGNYHASSKNELVIFVTPHIVETSEGSVKFHNLLDAHSDKGKTAAN
jgi:type II secretory pathway component GspD/PulD (secretin)